MTSPSETDIEPDAPKTFPVDTLEVTTTFELERKTLTLAQIKMLQPGYVIELQQPLNQSVVRIFANGMPVGCGHLVAVGDNLGICMSELVLTDDRNNG